MPKPRIDPHKWGIVPKRAAYEFLGVRDLLCPRCEVVQAHEGFRFCRLPWAGLRLPFSSRPWTTGQVGKRMTAWACTGCGGITELIYQRPL
jgi:hypothetical protein